MKNLQRCGVTVALTLVLALPALAGQMDTGPGATPPPPNPTSATTQGGMSTGAGAAVAGDSLAGAALSLLQSVLSLF